MQTSASEHVKKLNVHSLDYIESFSRRSYPETTAEYLLSSLLLHVSSIFPFYNLFLMHGDRLVVKCLCVSLLDNCSAVHYL